MPGFYDLWGEVRFHAETQRRRGFRDRAGWERDISHKGTKAPREMVGSIEFFFFLAEALRRRGLWIE